MRRREVKDSKKSEIPSGLIGLRDSLGSKLEAVAKVYPRLKVAADDEDALHELVDKILIGNIGLTDEEVEKVLATLTRY